MFALLPVEVSTLSRVDQHLIRFIALRGNIGVVSLVAQLRNQRALGLGSQAMLPVDLVARAGESPPWQAVA